MLKHTIPASLREQIVTAVDQAIEDDNLDNLTDLSGRITDAVLAVVLPATHTTACLARDSEAAVQRVIALYERWVKAGPPPLGTSINRWVDSRLAELHNALLNPSQGTEEQGAPVDWQGIAQQRERELKAVGEARRRAEMAIARVRLIKKAPSRSAFNRQANAVDDGWDQALDAVHAALGAPERCETGNARKDHPVHELLAALERGEPHASAVELVGRYYDSIHQLCCPYDHSERRPGYAAAANRAALDETEEV